MKNWWIYHGDRQVHNGIESLPPPPRWRQFKGVAPAQSLPPITPYDPGYPPRGATYQASDQERELVNTALFLRRPLLITGKPGTGKTSLAYAVAHELNLGPVLLWPINTRSTLQEGLYGYDAVARLQAMALLKQDEQTTEHDASSMNIGNYVRLGPLGTALLPSRYPRVLLIDEIDKSDIDLPNDLLNIFEEGSFTIPELARLPKAFETINVRQWDSDEVVPITRGRVECAAFPFIVLTSNGERDFPPAFLRRCIRLDVKEPDAPKLAAIVELQLGPAELERAKPVIDAFIHLRDDKGRQITTDQLLNALYLTGQPVHLSDADKAMITDSTLRSLTDASET